MTKLTRPESGAMMIPALALILVGCPGRTEVPPKAVPIPAVNAPEPGVTPGEGPKSSRLGAGRRAMVLPLDPDLALPAPGWGMFWDTSEEHWHTLSAGDFVLVLSDDSTEPWADSVGYGKSTRQVLVKIVDGEDRGRTGKIARDVLAPVE